MGIHVSEPMPRAPLLLPHSSLDSFLLLLAPHPFLFNEPGASKALQDSRRRNWNHWLLHWGLGEAQFFLSPVPLSPEAPSAGLYGAENQVNGILSASG